jgi:hypothetical protein
VPGTAFFEMAFGSVSNLNTDPTCRILLTAATIAAPCMLAKQDGDLKSNPGDEDPGPVLLCEVRLRDAAAVELRSGAAAVAEFRRMPTGTVHFSCSAALGDGSAIGLPPSQAVIGMADMGIRSCLNGTPTSPILAHLSATVASVKKPLTCAGDVLFASSQGRRSGP